jgi:hypothetical protein
MGGHMQEQFRQVLLYIFYLYKTIIVIVFTIALWIDLSEVHSLIATGTIVAAVFAAFAFFNPIVDIVLMLSLIALAAFVAHGYCRSPNLYYGVQGCVATSWGIAFTAITDVIHGLLELIPHWRSPGLPFD